VMKFTSHWLHDFLSTFFKESFAERKKSIEASKPKPASARPLLPPNIEKDKTITEKASRMLAKAEECFEAQKYKDYVELLEKTVQLGSAKAAVKLALVHHT
ncbi:34521_t:CDS:2, partial [Racocetra persica]